MFFESKEIFVLSEFFFHPPVIEEVVDNARSISSCPSMQASKQTGQETEDVSGLCGTRYRKKDRGFFKLAEAFFSVS
jgi:hypothetical protein